MRTRDNWVIAALVLCNMLSGTLLIPAVRPFFDAYYGGNESAMHAFFSVNMLGAVIGAPLLTMIADRRGARRQMTAILALVDAALLIVCTLDLPLGALLTIRVLQGAASVATLSLLMGAAPKHNSIGLPGAALVVAIALGAPLGTLVLQLGPAAALEAAAILGVSVGLASLVWLPADAPRAPRGSVRALLKHPLFLRLPTLWIGVERFTVGCFVVTFSLYAHHVLGLSDARVGMLFSCFLIPFALATWPMATLATRLDRGWLLGVGAVVYGIAFLLLGVTSAAALPLVLGLAGTASAAIYGPSLCLVASLAPKSLGATAMGLANAAGTLGMLAGTATAGILSAALAARGVERADIYSTLFWIAGGSELVLVALSVPALRAVSRDRAANLTPIAS